MFPISLMIFRTQHLYTFEYALFPAAVLTCHCRVITGVSNNIMALIHGGGPAPWYCASWLAGTAVTH